MTVAVLALGLAFGCANHSAKWYGRWEGDLKRAAASAPDDPTKRTIDLLRLDIKPDGTFEVLESGFDKSGTHKLGSEQAFLTVKTILGRPVDEIGGGTKRENKDVVLTWLEDGTIEWRDPAGFGGPVVLRKSGG
jgi:hypothetical protein